jgi:hypothetical protein
VLHAAHEQIRQGEQGVGGEERAADRGDRRPPGEAKQRVVEVAQRRVPVADDADLVVGARIVDRHRFAFHGRDLLAQPRRFARPRARTHGVPLVSPHTAGGVNLTGASGVDEMFS